MKQVLTTIASALACTAAVAAQTPAAPTVGAGTSPTAGAVLVDVGGRSVGQARFQETPHGVIVRLELKNATPGVHGVHVHDVGRCEPPSFESAGGHFSPDRKAHGFLNARGPHYTTDPSGDSGARLACGPIVQAGK